MKLLILLLFPLSAMSQYLAYEPIIWVGSERTAPPDTVRLDTVAMDVPEPYVDSFWVQFGGEPMYVKPYKARIISPDDVDELLLPSSMIYAKPYKTGQMGEIICDKAGADTLWMPNYAPCDDVDTVFGRVIYANEYRVLSEKGYMVTTWGHHEQLVEIKGRSTPQMTWMHWDWVRDKEPKSIQCITNIGEAIELKNVIKFIPNE